MATTLPIAGSPRALSQTTKVKESLTKLSLPSAAAPAWQGINSGTEALARAYDLPKP